MTRIFQKRLRIGLLAALLALVPVAAHAGFLQSDDSSGNSTSQCVATTTCNYTIKAGSTSGVFTVYSSQTVIAPPQTATVTVTTGGTITTVNTSTVTVATTTAAVTGVILSAGTIDMQKAYIVNKSANSITMAASGTSNVANGVTDVIAAASAHEYIWIAGAALWYPIVL